MRKLFIVVALVGVLVPGLALAQAAAAKPAAPAAPAAQARPAAQTAEQAVTALENAWLTAFTTGDAAWYEKNLAAGIVYTTENAEVRNKAAIIGRLKTEPFKGTATGAVEKVIVYGDTAIAIGTEIDKGTQNGKDASGSYRWTDTWVKIGGQWQCVATQSTTVPAK